MTQTSVPTTDERPLLIVISTGPHRYREYLFASMHSRYRIHLINTAEPTWERPYIAGFTLVASTEADLVLGAAREVAARGQVHGVMSWDEARILQAALVAQDLGLPGSTPDAVRRCRDKHESRLAMAAAGLPQPRFELVGEREEALAAAERIGYPVVLKPRAAAASYGVVLVHDADELAAHFTFSRTATVPHAPRFTQSVLVEQYLAEHEVSVDSVVYQGKVEPLFVAHKEIGFPPYFEETGHYVDGADPLLDDPELRRLLQDTHTALGYTDGWTHAEFKLTASGPKVIEVNGRLGGDLIPYLGLRATGIDPGLAAAAVACGREPDTTGDRAQIGGVRFFYPDTDDAVIESVTFDERLLPAQTDSAVALAVLGDVVSPPPKGLVTGRIAFATVLAGTVEECRSALDQTKAALRVRTSGTTAVPKAVAGSH